MHATTRTAMLCIAVMGLGGTVPAMAAPAFSSPQRLTNTQLDRITAGSGVTLNLTSAAASVGGSFASAVANGAGISNETSLPGGAFVDGGLVFGTASATGTGATGTSVSTSGSAGGTPLLTLSGGGTVVGPMGSASIGFTYVAGGTLFLP